MDIWTNWATVLLLAKAAPELQSLLVQTEVGVKYSYSQGDGDWDWEDEETERKREMQRKRFWEKVAKLAPKLKHLGFERNHDGGFDWVVARDQSGPKVREADYVMEWNAWQTWRD